MDRRYSTIAWMFFPGSESKFGILVPARILLAFAMNRRRRRGFQYSVTLQGEFSSGPNVPPTPLIAWHFKQCATNNSWPGFESPGSRPAKASAEETNSMATIRYGHGYSSGPPGGEIQT